MADISAYKDSIQAASTGVEIRDPLAKALNAINMQGRDAATFNNLSSDYFAKRVDVVKLMPIPGKIDRYPTRKSTRLVAGGGIFAVIGDMDDFDWG